MRTGITPLLKLREECWLDETRYAWPDDQVFFYKSHLLGLQNFSCKQPKFKHLDGKSGIAVKERLIDYTYSWARNSIIFWRKFVINQKKTTTSKLGAKLNFKYYLFINSLMLLIKGSLSRDLSLFRTFRKGIKDGYAYSI